MTRKKVTIHKINRQEKEFSKDGKTWTSVTIGILVNPDENVWLNGFQDDQSERWKQGDEVLVDVETKQGKNGKTYYNFKTIDPKELQLDRMEEKLDNILKHMSMGGTPYE